jgi:hypothetical protein
VKRLTTGVASSSSDVASERNGEEGICWCVIQEIFWIGAARKDRGEYNRCDQ